MDDITKINNDADLSRYLDRIPETPYKQGHKKMLTDLINYAGEHQWTLRTLSDKLPVSTTVMHRLLIGNYQSPAGPHPRHAGCSHRFSVFRELPVSKVHVYLK